MGQVVKKPESLPDNEGAFLGMIERAARDPSIDVDKMDRLLQMQERVMLREDERAFNEAMRQTQSEMRHVAADSSNPQTRSRYASYAALDKALRPIYTKYGLVPSFNTDKSELPDHIRVVCYLAMGRYTRPYHVDMPADGKGAKGGDVMTKTHATGSAMTYGMRYLLKMIFNVAIGEDDDDGNAASRSIGNDLVGSEEILELQNMIKRIGGEKADDLEKGTLKYLKVARLADIPMSEYPRAVKALKTTEKNRGAK